MKLTAFSLIAAVVVGMTGCITIRKDEPVATVTTTYQPGYVVTTLPAGYQTVRVRDSEYYKVSGTYYRRYEKGGYVVVNNPF
jgi:hypothetical protein